VNPQLESTKHPEKPHRRFVFVDRDGVINIERGDYTTTIDEWQWAPGSLEGIKLLTDAGYHIIVITNQACIAKGIQTEEGLRILNEYMIDTIRSAGGDILAVYHCPHGDSDRCECRKPKPGMLLKAAEEHDIPLPDTFFIGDAPRDMEAGMRAGTRTILVTGTDTGADDISVTEADFRAVSLLDAARIVIREDREVRENMHTPGNE